MADLLSSCSRPPRSIAITLVVAFIFLQLRTSECWKINIKVVDDIYDAYTYIMQIPLSPVKEKDIDIFQLSDENLRNAINLTFNEFPDKVYLTSPKNKDEPDLFKMYNWSEVIRTINIEPNILNITSEEVKSFQSPTFSAFWTKDPEANSQNVSIDYEFQMDIEIILELKNSLHVTWKTVWGKPGIESSSEPTEVSGHVERKITKRTAFLKVDFKACLTGYVAVTFHYKVANNYYKAIRIADVLEKKLGLRTCFDNSQIIKVVYYI